MRTALFASFRRRLGTAVAGGIVLSLFVGAAPAAERESSSAALRDAFFDSLFQSERFSELVGRPFSEGWKESSVGWTDMHYAALLDLPEVIAALADAGMDVDVRLKTGFVPFGDDLQQTLDSLGYKNDKVAAGQTPLLIAAFMDARQAAAELLAQGADINTTPSQDEHGFTPLLTAVMNRSVETATLLLESGADVNAATFLKSRTERTPKAITPLDFAVMLGLKMDTLQIQNLLRRYGGKCAALTC